MLIFISLIFAASGEKGCATKSMLDYTFALPDCDQWLAKEKEFSCLKALSVQYGENALACLGERIDGYDFGPNDLAKVSALVEFQRLEHVFSRGDLDANCGVKCIKEGNRTARQCQAFDEEDEFYCLAMFLDEIVECSSECGQ